jgi:anaerobic selenocysteine-containing dehydrogenase
LPEHLSGGGIAGLERQYLLERGTAFRLASREQQAVGMDQPVIDVAGLEFDRAARVPHGFARTRVILREIQNDPARSMIVIDPRRSETAEMADMHLAVRPGTDAWCLAALAAIIVQDGLIARTWIDEHTSGYAPVADALQRISVPDYAGICGVDEALLRSAAERIAHAGSVSMIEDLGVQMNLHSTLNSYLNRLVWLLTGHYARPGTNNAFVPLLGLLLSPLFIETRDRSLAD